MVSRRQLVLGGAGSLLLPVLALAKQSPEKVLGREIVKVERLLSSRFHLMDYTAYSQTNKGKSDEAIEAAFPATHDRTYGVEATLQYTDKKAGEGSLAVILRVDSHEIRLKSNLDGSGFEPDRRYARIGQEAYAQFLNAIESSKRRELDTLAEKAQTLAGLVLSRSSIYDHPDVSDFTRAPHMYPNVGVTDRFQAGDLFFFVHGDEPPEEKGFDLGVKHPISGTAPAQLAIGISVEGPINKLPMIQRDAAMGDFHIDGILNYISPFPEQVTERFLGATKLPSPATTYGLTLDRLARFYRA